MITLIHGDNLTQSYAELERIRAQARLENWEIVDVSGEGLDSKKWEELNSSQNLWAEKRLIVISGYFGSKREKIAFETPAENVVFYENKKISGVPKIAGLVIKKFDVDPVVFKFLESLRPGGAKISVKLWQQYISTEKAEIAFVMVVRQFRFLLLANGGGSSNDEWDALQGWQKSRLASQSALFNPQALIKNYQKLQDIEESVKTGVSSLSLEVQLELLLLSI